MKKFLALTLAVVMLCLSCFALAETATGTEILTLYLDKLISGENTYSAADLGMVITMVFYDDGTVKMEVLGETETATWVEDGDYLVVTMENGTMTLCVDPEDPTSVLGVNPEFDTETYIFTTNEITPVELPAIIEATDISEFNGTYVTKYLNAFGVTANIESMIESGELATLMGDNMTSLDVVIENGKVAAFGDDVIDMILTDGKLTVDPAATEAANELGIDLGIDLSTAVTVLKTETGIVVSMLGGMLMFYCE